MTVDEDLFWRAMFHAAEMFPDRVFRPAPDNKIICPITGREVGMSEYAATLYEGMGGTMVGSSGRKQISSAITRQKFLLQQRLDEMRLEPGDVSKIHLLRLRLRLPDPSYFGLDALVQEGTEEEKTMTWNCVLRGHAINKVFELLMDGNPNDIVARQALLLKQAIFHGSFRLTSLVDDVEPVWDWLMARLRREDAGKVLQRLLSVACDLSEKDWIDGREDEVVDV